MVYVLSVIGSIVEFFGTMVFMLTVHRIEITKRRVVDLIVLSALMSQVSYFTRANPAFGESSSFIQLGLTILLIWLIFKIPLFYSVVMNVPVLATGLVAQGVIILAVSFGTGTALSTVRSEIEFALPIQILTSLLFLTLTYVIKYFNLGFNYVPTSCRAYVSMRGLNLVILTVIFVIVAGLSAASIALNDDFDTYLYVVVAVFMASIPLFLYYAYRKDNEDVEKSVRISSRADGRGRHKG